MRFTCLELLELDILGLAETHLAPGEVLGVNGYTWYGHNRKLLHRNAKCGSGGVGFLIREEFESDYGIEIIDDSYEGILWIKMEHKIDKFKIFACCCYLPPNNSSRQVDVHEFFDTILSGIYKYQDNGLIFICGDFNSRCGENADYIAGVDEVTDRDVVDFTCNFYGDIFIDFLVNANYILRMLNGRNFIHNDFTSVSSKGSAVVDYCVVSHDSLSTFKQFTVIRATELVNRAIVERGLSPSSIPDHSPLTWVIECMGDHTESVNQYPESCQQKYD